MATIKFVPSADASVVSEHSRDVLRSVLDAAGIGSCVVTSTVRSPARQARTMYVNIEATSIERQLALYCAAGDVVIHEYQRLKPLGHGRDTIISAMEAKIIELGPGSVSKHCADPLLLNVIDIAPSSISNHTRFMSSLPNHLPSLKATRWVSGVSRTVSAMRSQKRPASASCAT